MNPASAVALIILVVFVTWGLTLYLGFAHIHSWASAMYFSRQTRREAREREAREEKLRLERRKKAEDRGIVATSEVSLVTDEADGTATTVSATV
ncbi:hypothetical protein BDZ45DRAFT_672566 [Acephala macrosclerotiorum]|nr:hypothetical protein BDZ45DRAFT_672566 [Acephala macrosclerotiorum]